MPRWSSHWNQPQRRYVTAVNAISANGTRRLESKFATPENISRDVLTRIRYYASPITVACQPNFIIVISDGIYNRPVDPRVEATNRFTQDHATGVISRGTRTSLSTRSDLALDWATSMTPEE